MAPKIKITQCRSAVGRLKRQKMTVKALGLGRPGHSVVHDDTPAIRSMARSVRHLVDVEEVGEGRDA
jgi:large subunit ribosomal protein L30